jgi:hypothetical protein
MSAPASASAPAHTHELDLAAYSLDETLALFDLTRDSLSTAGLRRARHQVLMLHPDKSRLPPAYFLFYKRALDLVVGLHAEQARAGRTVPHAPLDYDAETAGAPVEGVQDQLARMDARDFSARFNAAFEAHAPDAAKVRDPRRNEWFTRTDADLPEVPIKSVAAMGAACDAARERLSSAVTVRAGGVQTLRAGVTATGELYDEDEDADGVYVTSDPFAKLKFDDLRKVHKDQTVLPVSERDFAHTTTFSNVEGYVRARGAAPEPMREPDALRVLDTDAAAARARVMEKAFADAHRGARAEASGRAALATFLRIT